MFGKSLETLKEVGTRQDEARVLVEISYSIFALGNDAEAERGWYKALQIPAGTQSTFIALEALVGIAMLTAEQGNTERALELSWIVLNHPASLQETKNCASDLLMKLESQFTPVELATIQVHAREKSFEAVVKDLLK